MDREVVRGLKTLVLTAVGSLTHRAQQYEQVREGGREGGRNNAERKMHFCYVTLATCDQIVTHHPPTSHPLTLTQGVRIPSLVTVCLELQGTDIQFSPPLSPLSPLPTVPEVVHHWMEGYSNTASLVVRQLPGVEVG